MNLQATTRPADDLVHDNLPLVRKLAASMLYRVAGSLELADLVSLGTEGLIQAAHRYDPTSGASFQTFAYHRIRGAIIDGIARHAPMSRKAYRRHVQEQSHEVTASPQHQPVPELADGDDPADSHVLGRQMRELLERAIAKLPERKKRLIRACYFDGSTLERAGADLNISKSWASRMHASTLAELREQLTRWEPHWQN